jgi:hypothetical protein
MNHTHSNNLKNSFSKVLFAVFLLLGFFCFSGIAIQSQPKLNVPQTTLVVGYNNTLIKSISYKRALGKVDGKYPAISLLFIPAIDLGRLHSNMIKTCISVLSTLYIKQTIFDFYPVRFIPQNNGNNPAITLG